MAEAHSIYSQHKIVSKIIIGKEKEVARLRSPDNISSGLLMKELNMVNVYQIKIPEHYMFMFNVKNSIIPRAFNSVSSLTDHIYSTRFSNSSFKICHSM